VLATREAVVDGHQRGEAIFRALFLHFVQHGEKPVRRQVDDALPLAGADAKGAGSCDELFVTSPAGGVVSWEFIAGIISATLSTPEATIGPIIIAMTGSFSAIVMAVRKFAVTAFPASSANDSGVRESTHSTGFPVHSATRSGVLLPRTCSAKI
jgi:hypothetical protein